VIAVDTSVWVSVLRSRDAPEAPILSALLDAGEVMLPVLVRLELRLGAAGRDRARLRRVLSALPVGYPSEDIWPLMESWAERAADAGQRFGAGDLLVAAIASAQGALVWSLDRDFTRMERLRFVKLYAA
jgi:predicted nucleic acid-binding protein